MLRLFVIANHSAERAHMTESQIANLDGKVAIVTGAGRGIGQALARQLAACGAAVVVNDLDREPAAQTVDLIVGSGGTAIACPGSVTAAEFPQQLVDSALEEHGRIDIIVNNAGYIWNDPLHKISEEQWDAIQDVHLKAPFRILKAAAPYIMGAAKNESELEQRVVRKVVNVSSVSATRGAYGQSNYAAAKSGLFGLTRSLAQRVGPLQRDRQLCGIRLRRDPTDHKVRRPANDFHCRPAAQGGTPPRSGAGGRSDDTAGPQGDGRGGRRWSVAAVPSRIGLHIGPDPGGRRRDVAGRDWYDQVSGNAFTAAD